MTDFLKTSLEYVLYKPISGSRPKGGVSFVGEIPSLGGENITMEGGLKLKVVKKISSEFFKSMPRGQLRNLDVLINKDGANTGKSSIYRKSPFLNAAINEHLFILRGKEGKLDQEYLHYLMQFSLIRAILEIKIAGSAQPGINSTFVKNFPVDLAPFPEQKKIASILTSVDEVIDNTQKQIDKLQNLKKATMEKLLTKGIGHTEFRDCDLGRIPQSWEMKSLSEISELSRGKFSHRPRNDPAFYDGRYPFLQTGDIPVDNLEITSFTQSLNDKGLEVSKLFPEDTLVLTIAATIGEVGLLKFDSCFPDSLVGISIDQAFVRKYFLLFSLRYWKERLILEAPESAQKNLNLDILNSFHVAVPPLNEQKEIESILISIQNHIEVKNNELSQTRSLKKSLMQDLLTGKVRVTVN